MQSWPRATLLPARRRSEGSALMSKDRNRGNREPKKPKATKKPAAQAASFLPPPRDVPTKPKDKGK